VRDRVPLRVRGADLDQLDGAVADPQVEAPVERRARHAQLDVAEAERAEDAADVRAELRPELVGVLERVEELWRRGPHVGDRRGGRVDLRARREQLVAEAVVAVAVGVQRGADRPAVGDTPHRVEHVAGEREVEERVDEQRSAVARDQAGVAPAPRPVGLEVGEQPVAELVEPLAVGGRHARGLPAPFATPSHDVARDSAPRRWRSCGSTSARTPQVDRV
jgi:hypothetical protein